MGDDSYAISQLAIQYGECLYFCILFTLLFGKESAAVRGIRRTICHSRKEILYILRRILFASSKS